MSQIWINRIDISDHTGYGRATNELIAALERADVDIRPQASTVINFCMPKDYIYHDYTVGYTPWESTDLPGGWKPDLMKVDELWSTSHWSSGILHSHTGREVKTVHHGLNPTWLPVLHEQNKTRPFTFLHVGEPAVRKGGDLVLAAWFKYFRFTNCRLIYKTTGQPMGRIKDRSGSIAYAPPMVQNGQIISKIYSDLEMWRLYCEVDCLVYPTRGEGFGLIPLEAIASGLPTILPSGGGTGDFSELGIPLNNYMWVASHEGEHPGLWMDHDVDEIIDRMRGAISNYNAYAECAYVNAKKARDIFNWDEIAKKIIIMLDGHL